MEYTRTQEEAIHEGLQDPCPEPLFEQSLASWWPNPEFPDRSLELAGSDLLLGC
jgi:hypothetical protein